MTGMFNYSPFSEAVKAKTEALNPKIGDYVESSSSLPIYTFNTQKKAASKVLY
jgi:hypothetical protein